jgi:hypothetical protein
MVMDRAGRRARPGPAVPASAYALLGRARSVLDQAAAAESAAERFCLAHLAALRAVAALIAERGRPAAAGKRLISAWVLADVVAPEYREWSAYFAAGAATRAAVEAGASTVVSDRDADDQIRAAQQFVHLVESGFRMHAVRLAS